MYAACLELAGELSTFTRDSRRPIAYPVYRHDDLAGSFGPVVADIRRSMSIVLERSAVPIELQTRAYGLQVAAIPHSDLVKTAQFVLAAKAQLHDERRGPVGRAPAPAHPPPSARGDHAEVADAAAVSSGLNPLIAQDNRLLNVLPQLRSSVQHPNPAALRDSLAQGVRQFEAQARAAGVTTEKIVAARYALCTLIDETATSTPLGASGAWAHQGLLALFHGETGGGEKFFQLLARLAENPQANLDLLELLYVCLEFGFEGRYRVTEGGQRQLEAIRQRLLMIIRKQRGEYERDLSPNWRGLSAANQRRLGWMPLWAVVAVSALLLVAIYIGFEWRLSRTSDKIAADIAALRVPAPVPPRPAAPPRLATFLAEEIRRGLVKVDDHVDRSVVTILGDGLFKPGEAAIGTDDQWLLGRIGDALKRVPGQVDVIGHSDNIP